MLLAKVKEVAVRNHGYVVVTVSAEALQQTRTTVASETEWGPWLSDLPLLPPSEQLQAEEASFVLENVFFPCLNECDVQELATYVNIWLEGRQQGLVPVSWYQPQNVRKACEYLVFLWKLCNFAIVIEKTRKWVKILF
jgi:hypothetical protein